MLRLFDPTGFVDQAKRQSRTLGLVQTNDRFSRIFARGTKYRRIVAIAYVHITRSVDQAVILRAKLSRKR